MNEAEYIIAVELERQKELHPDVAIDDDSWLHYRSCVFEAGDWDQGYQKFAQERDAYWQSVDSAQNARWDANKTPHERAIGRAADAVGTYLAEKSMGMHR